MNLGKSKHKGTHRGCVIEGRCVTFLEGGGYVLGKKRWKEEAHKEVRGGVNHIWASVCESSDDVSCLCGMDWLWRRSGLRHRETYKPMSNSVTNQRNVKCERTLNLVHYLFKKHISTVFPLHTLTF